MLKRAVRFTNGGDVVLEYRLTAKMSMGRTAVVIELVAPRFEAYPKEQFDAATPGNAVLIAVERMKDWPQHKGLRCDVDYKPTSMPDLRVME